MVVIKKYSNRRLYDTSQSRYITQEELADLIRNGADPKVLDAKTGEDLTQATLTQIVMESRGGGRLFSVPVLLQLIRMDAGALAEFLGHTVGWALNLYLGALRGVASLSPFGGLPFANPLSSLIGWPVREPWRAPEKAAEAAAAQTQTAAAQVPESEVVVLRREVEQLKRQLDEMKGA